ncbi:MAG: MFS transporter [Deltaproteobacteria bacterium]|nr:MFS transporter [Deltaproteobacteria bacterium]
MLCLASCLGALGLNLFVVAPRYLRAVVHLEASQIGLVMGAHSLCALLMMTQVPRLADGLGRRRLMELGMSVCAVACASFAVPTTLAPLVLLRGLMGAGWACVLIGSVTYTTEFAPPGRLAQALGVAGVLTLLAMAIGPLVGEFMLARVSFSWLCIGAAGFMLAGLIFTRALPHSPPATATTTPAAAPTPGAPAPARALAIASAAPLPLLATLLAAGGFGAVYAFLSDYATLRHLPSVTPFFNAYVGSAIAARLLLGGLSDRAGRHTVLIPALICQGLGLAGLALAHTSWHLIPIGMTFGFSHGLYYPTLQALIVERSPEALRTRAVASSNFSFSLGMTASAFANGLVAEHLSYPAVFVAVGAASILAGGVVALDHLLSRAPARPPRSAAAAGSAPGAADTPPAD